MVIVFDLDDTLYEEISFVLSGFKVVANFISSEFGINYDRVYETLKNNFKVSREKVFDRTYDELKIKKTKNLIKKTLSIYRKHKPDIQLYNEAKECLKRFKDYPIYIVTDGNIITQKNKLVALNLYSNPIIKKCFITHRFGLKNSKPSPYCFIKISQIEKVPFDKIVYIGDNPNKDFVGIKPLGFKTVRVLTGPYKDLNVPSNMDAEIKIQNLSFLTLDLLKKVFPEFGKKTPNNS